MLNFVRRRPGRNACEGWIEASAALERAKLRDAGWRRPPLPF
jgi:inorganic pyrophosphatase